MLIRFLDWFERHKIAVIGTLVLHVLVLFVLAIWKLQSVPREDQISDMRMEVISEEEAEQLLQRMEMDPMEAGGPVTNLTSNITAELGKPSYNSERLSERVENDLRAFEQAEFDRLAEERRERGEEIEVPELDPSKWDKELYMDKAVEAVKIEGATTVWHDLDKPKRVDRNIKVPAYVCRGFGQVVVNVVVDREGVVRDARIDAGMSTTSDECMLERALLSARTARFAPNSSAPDRQSGNLYYRYMAQ